VTHAPDATGIGTSVANVRAERSGLGDGRVYAITFVADDGQGGTTTGRVRVVVPHDVRGNTCDAVDSGQKFNAAQ
jgi:von Willebrand factor A domain-containing protein 7